MFARRHPQRTGAIIVMVALCLCSIACEELTPAGISAISPANSPQSDADDWSSYWEETRDLGGYQGVHLNWDTSGAGNIPATILTTLAAGLRPVVVLGVTSALDDPLKQDQLRSMLTTLVTEYDIEYLGLGNEIDRNSRAWELAAFIDGLATFVHSLGTSTQVFTVFHYEHMLDFLDPVGLVAAVPSVDLVAFSSYPFLRYTSPVDIPADYYARLMDWTTKAIAFTEIAWPSRMNHPGYPTIRGSESDQVTFIQRFRAELTAGLPVLFANWYALHDTSNWYESDPLADFKQVFASCGLMRNGTDAKPALAVWTGQGTTPPA